MTTENEPKIEPTAPLLTKFLSRKLLVAVAGLLAPLVIGAGVPPEAASIAIAGVLALAALFVGVQGWVDGKQLDAAAVYTEARARVQAEAAKADETDDGAEG